MDARPPDSDRDGAAGTDSNSGREKDAEADSVSQMFQCLPWDVVWIFSFNAARCGALHGDFFFSLSISIVVTIEHMWLMFCSEMHLLSPLC